MLQESILQYFRPSLSYHLSLRLVLTIFEALPGVLGNRGKRGIYFRGTGEQRPNLEQGNEDNIGEQGT